MKRQLILFMLFTMFIFLAACGTETNLDNKSHADSGNEYEGIEEQNGTNENVDTVDNDEEPLVENQNENTNENTNVETITETGTYIGQADPHTIEIETSSGPLAFQLTMEAREDVEKLTVGENVEYTFTDNGETREIQSIVGTEGSTDLIESTGIYNGQADPHTIEIETSSGPLAFQLTMEMREVVEKLNVGEEVKYFYTEDGIYREIQKIETTK